MNVYEMEGFLRGKCLPGDMKVNESDAQYLVRKFSELQSQNADMAVQLANAESKCRELQRDNDSLEAVAVSMRDDMREAREKLRAAEKRIAEQSEIVAAAEKLVRCKGRYHSELNYRALAKLFGVTTPDLPPLEHKNVHYADAAEMEIAALRQRIAELEAKLETADKLQDSAFRHGLQHGFSYGQTNDQAGYEQCLKSYSSRGKDNG